jgi:hypothetical protein
MVREHVVVIGREERRGGDERMSPGQIRRSAEEAAKGTADLLRGRLILGSLPRAHGRRNRDQRDRADDQPSKLKSHHVSR